MHTISEIAVTAAIWILTAVGTFFSIRAAMLRKRSQRMGKKQSTDNEA
jgi:hypothetical protein